MKEIRLGFLATFGNSFANVVIAVVAIAFFSSGIYLFRKGQENKKINIKEAILLEIEKDHDDLKLDWTDKKAQNYAMAIDSNQPNIGYFEKMTVIQYFAVFLIFLSISLWLYIYCN